MPVLKEPNAEPIPGYRLVQRLGNGAFGEVWKCEAPGGIRKAIKFVYGDLNGVDSARADEELRAIELVKSIRHPFLLSIDRVENMDGELMIVTELADQNLHQLFMQCRRNGQIGIARDDLIRYLEEASEILDVMNLECHLQHLDIKPHNIFLVRNHVKVADFGLVNRLSVGGNGESDRYLGSITPIYASPEVFNGKISGRSDQYSLAVAYQELLTGELPFSGTNARQLLLEHTKKLPNLDQLAGIDRDAVARALAKNPIDRFPSCMDFIRALRNEEDAPLTIVDGPPPIAVASASKKLPHVNGTAPTTAPAAIEKNFLPGFQFVEMIGHSPLNEIWRVIADDGTERLAKLIYGVSFNKNQRTAILSRLESLDHPALLREQIVHAEPGQLVLLSNRIKESLRDRFYYFRRRKMPGIARDELLEYIRAAAEALDFLYLQHSISHLGLNPRKMILDRGWLQLAEFGFAQLLWLPSRQDVAGSNARYAPPELWTGETHRSSDQFSLAVIYAEMLTGIHPFGGSTSPANDVEPKLERLPGQDREVVAKALDRDPRNRWSDATEMVMALEGAGEEMDDVEHDAFIALVSQPITQRAKPPSIEATRDLNQLIAELITENGGAIHEDFTDVWELSDDDTLRYEFTAGLPLGAARVKLDELAAKWFAMDTRDDDGAFRFNVNMPSNFWRQWIGASERLEVRIVLDRVQAMSPTPIHVAAEIHAVSANPKRRRQWLEEIGPALLDSVQNLLLVNSEKRMQDRILWPHAVTVIPIMPEGKHGEPVECRGKDISLRGMGFYLPEELAVTDVLIRVPNKLHPPAISIPATLVRAKRCADGWYDVGALFRLPAPKKSFAEIALPVCAEK